MFIVSKVQDEKDENTWRNIRYKRGHKWTFLTVQTNFQPVRYTIESNGITKTQAGWKTTGRNCDMYVILEWRTVFTRTKPSHSPMSTKMSSSNRLIFVTVVLLLCFKFLTLFISWGCRFTDRSKWNRYQRKQAKRFHHWWRYIPMWSSLEGQERFDTQQNESAIDRGKIPTSQTHALLQRLCTNKKGMYLLYW